MKKLTKWQKKLTAKERKHLNKDAGIFTLAQMRAQVAFMSQHEQPDCFDCFRIAKKLGMI